jgi:phosphoribosyl 1,2-cyclic phosphodiesterase
MWFCSLYSGSSGNCLYVGTGRTNILVDAGLSGKKVINALGEIGIQPKEIQALLVTHEHIDHIKGIGVLSRMFNIPVYANNNTWESMREVIGNIKDENVRIINTDDVFEVGDIEVKSFKTPHDAAESVGYSFLSDGRKVSIATDIGHVSDNVFNNIKNSDLVLLESNHDVEMLKFGPYPYILKRRILSDIGHLSNEDAGKAIVRLSKDRYMTVVLGHLSQQNNYPELAYMTVLSILEENNIKIDCDIKLDIAGRDSVSKFIEIK